MVTACPTQLWGPPYHPPFPWQEDWQPSVSPSAVPHLLLFSSENRQVLTKYPTSEDEKGLGNRYQQTFHRDTRQRRNLIAFVLLANLSRSHVNLKSYQSLYSEFTSLPPNVLKCPCHLMSTHSYSWLPREASSSSYFRLWRQLSLDLLPWGCKDMLFGRTQWPRGREVHNSRLCSVIYHHHTSLGACAPNSFTEQNMTSTYTHSFESPVVHISPTSVLMALPPGEGK